MHIHMSMHGCTHTSTFPSTYVITFHYLICGISSSIWLPQTIPISNCHTPAHHSASWLSSCLQGCRYCSKSHKCKTNPNSQLQRVPEADFVLYVSLWDDLQCKYYAHVQYVCMCVCVTQSQVIEWYMNNMWKCCDFMKCRLANILSVQHSSV